MAELDQWFTPEGVSNAFQDWANIAPDDVVIDPAAGEGSLLPDRPGVLAFEIDPERVEELKYWKPQAIVVCADFLATPSPPEHVADVALQNPPYGQDGEGTFIYQSLLWAPRCCALIRISGLFGERRWHKCWRHVQVLRKAYLVHRPHFEGIFGSATAFTPQYDFVAVECVMREKPLEKGEIPDDPQETSWVFWR